LFKTTRAKTTSGAVVGTNLTGRQPFLLFKKKDKPIRKCKKKTAPAEGQIA